MKCELHEKADSNQTIEINNTSLHDINFNHWSTRDSDNATPTIFNKSAAVTHSVLHF